MRLWHEALIPYLPRQQLLGQHRECCALRGNGWGKKHATVNYVFEHPYGWLVLYHYKVMREMDKRGYKADLLWTSADYRGKKCERLQGEKRYKAVEDYFEQKEALKSGAAKTIYPEHNDAYLQECLQNLEGKGIHIDMEAQND